MTTKRTAIYRYEKTTTGAHIPSAQERAVMRINRIVELADFG